MRSCVTTNFCVNYTEFKHLTEDVFLHNVDARTRDDPVVQIRNTIKQNIATFRTYSQLLLFLSLLHLIFCIITFLIRSGDR